MAYLYRHIRLDKNVPFYIGIGSDINYKRANQVQSRNRHWKFVVAKTQYEVEILMDGITWETACIKEKEFIKLYGRRDIKTGTLVNLTDGGDGSVGVIISEESKRKMSQSLKGRVFSQEHRKNLSLLAKGRKYSPEVIKKMSDRGKLFTFTEERNQKVSEGLKLAYASGRRVAATKGKPVSEDTRKKLSIAATGRLHTPEAKQKMSQSKIGNKVNFGRVMSQETKDKISEVHKGIKASPELRKKLSEAHRGKVLSQEQKDKISLALKGRKKPRLKA